ncbi:antibiotic biosynthesis monooxygenase [Chitinophaga oryzae]|uniref:Antibiotic biosynthesis monooxygenase n=1 Tax=Chitinophaga oryzae TaxID=2725414 RepID=A0AAE7D6V1_9BACT|nr:putative quinol monooxygenase [Chitinophaga oryzae]QJB31062.1 antibiotic biosynthesis monooxygenase [Chitinophaga oryzae]QJB37547.1 antibiotic biosynthesis monooxygenase [Chitinophaga oryzae]
MIVIEAIFEAFEGKADAMLALCQRTVADTLPEKGCLVYRFARSMYTDTQFILFEVWESEADLKAHFERAAFLNFFRDLPALGVGVEYKAWQGNNERYIPPNGKPWW